METKWTWTWSMLCALLLELQWVERGLIKWQCPRHDGQAVKWHHGIGGWHMQGLIGFLLCVHLLLDLLQHFLHPPQLWKQGQRRGIFKSSVQGWKCLRNTFQLAWSRGNFGHSSMGNRLTFLLLRDCSLGLLNPYCARSVRSDSRESILTALCHYRININLEFNFQNVQKLNDESAKYWHLKSLSLYIYIYKYKRKKI